MVTLPRPEAVIFDWDNTLVDTWPTIHAALNKTFIELGVEPWPMERVKERVARSMRDSFPLIFGKDWQAAGDLYQKNFRAIHLERLTALPGAEAMLASLAKKPVFLAIASNKKGVNLRKEVEHIGWGKYFKNQIGADDTPKDKPAPEPVYAALAGSGLTPSTEVWFVGDSHIDMECANATGCTALFYGEPPEKPLGYSFAGHVKNHVELMELFDNILK